MAAPLDDITVLEIDNWMAAPSAGAVFADLGANVIKVEPLAGDPMRGMSRPAKIESAFLAHVVHRDALSLQPFGQPPLEVQAAHHRPEPFPVQPPGQVGHDPFRAAHLE